MPFVMTLKKCRGHRLRLNKKPDDQRHRLALVTVKKFGAGGGRGFNYESHTHPTLVLRLKGAGCETHTHAHTHRSINATIISPLSGRRHGSRGQLGAK